MINEPEIKRIARVIREVERHPDGTNCDQHFRTKPLLEEGEKALSTSNRFPWRARMPLRRERLLNYAVLRDRYQVSLRDSMRF